MRCNLYKIRLFLAIIVLILSVTAVLGIFYPVKFLDIEFTALLQRTIINYSSAAVVLFVLVLLLTVLFGRIYCSVLCPFGILQEIFAFLRGKRKNTKHRNYGFKYLIAAVVFGCMIGGSALLIRYIDPYTIFANAISVSIFGIIFTAVVLILVLLKNRFFCTNVCPVGTILGLISKLSVNKINMDKDACVSCGMCANSCPSGCIDYNEKTVDNEMCVKCFKCISVCPKNAMKYGKQKIEFNFKRRRLIWELGALAVLAAGYSAGVNFTKNIAKKVKDIILPAGAVNANRMANKCLNCNLCINNCTNKILVKADDKFNAVHIDYKKGLGYCEYNCNKCSEVCPSGAIKKQSLEQKQNTRIAMAVVNEYECIECKMCMEVCPKNAIYVSDNGKTKVDGSKCIGCGRCAAVCPSFAIKIYGVKEQTVI